MDSLVRCADAPLRGVGNRILHICCSWIGPNFCDINFNFLFFGNVYSKFVCAAYVAFCAMIGVQAIATDEERDALRTNAPRYFNFVISKFSEFLFKLKKTLSNLFFIKFWNENGIFQSGLAQAKTSRLGEKLKFVEILHQLLSGSIGKNDGLVVGSKFIYSVFFHTV